MKSWRPENWENPHTNCDADLERMGREIAFEAGADALLACLIDCGIVKVSQLEDYDANHTKGRIVFIPDVDNEESFR